MNMSMSESDSESESIVNEYESVRINSVSFFASFKLFC